MRRMIAFLLVLLLLPSPIGSSCAERDEGLAQHANAVYLFVAPGGSDMNDGSLEAPFQTLARAQLEVRALLRTQSGPITVNIRAGEYFMADSISFGPQDSGSDETPVTWQAYDGEFVLLSGGIRLSADSFTKESDPDILSRVSDERVRERLVSVDLTGYLPEFPSPVAQDTASEIQVGLPTIYIGGRPLVPARWPNDTPNAAYLYADSAEALSEEQYAGVTLTSKALAERAKGWSSGAWESMYVYSFMAWDWNEIVSDAVAFELEGGTVTTRAGAWGSPSQNPRFYVFNVPEEIDVPGESYIDYGKATVHFYPPEDFGELGACLSLQQAPLICLEDAENITLRGLALGYTRGNAISATQVQGITVDGCVIAHTSDCAVCLDIATGCVVKNCHIYDTENGGIYLWDGDLRKTLTQSGNIIENNDIHGTSRNRRCYGPPIYANSMGVIIRNNTLHDVPHLAIDISASNDAIIEYNEIYDCGLDTSDMGAIYYGRNPSIMGIQIRYNYFHDIGNSYGGYGQQAIFCDDGASMPFIYGNLFVNASDSNPDWGAAIKANGAQLGVVKHNVFVDSPMAAYFGSWTFSWDRVPIREDFWLFNCYGVDSPDDHGIWAKLSEEVDFFGELWKGHYEGSQWETLWTWLTIDGYSQAWRLLGSGNSGYPLDYGSNPTFYDFAYDHAPALTNRFEGNVCVNIALEGMFHENGTGMGNLALGTDIFVDYANRDFTLGDAALDSIRATIPGFECVDPGMAGAQPFEAYGRQRLPKDKRFGVSSFLFRSVLKFSGTVLFAITSNP